MAKQYGLIIPGKDKASGTPAPSLSQKNVFGSDSDDDEDSTKPGSSLNCATTLKRQVRLAQQKALEEDPTVFQYDEIYDEMESKKVDEKKTQEKKERKPRYIGKLLETAAKRKQEQERRVERQVQKEREAEGSEFADKESFVTTSYRKKLEELKQLEEQDKREDYLEAIGDVTKQQDLGGFYRHLYSQKLGGGKIPPKPELQDETSNTESEATKTESNQKQNRKRHYRKRSLSREKEENDTDELNVDNKQHLQSNLDADSDFSIDSSDSETEENVNKQPETASEVKIEADIEIKKEKDGEEKAKAPQWNDGFKIPEKVKNDEETKPVVPIKKPKIDIWKKRTVGDTLAGALQRYYERKSMRQIVF